MQHRRSCCSAAMLCLLIAAVQCSISSAADANAATQPAGSSQCWSQTQCYLARLGPPNSPGEWLMAYMSAVHEHCRTLLTKGNTAACQSSIRCVYLPLKLGGGGPSQLRASNASDSSSSSAGNMSQYWESVAAALDLHEPACLPNPFNLVQYRNLACPGRQSTIPEHDSGSKASDRLLKACTSDPRRCFIGNASNADDVASWWGSADSLAVLEHDSDWLTPDKNLRAAVRHCPDAWAQGTRQVVDGCATRGVGKAAMNGSITLNRLVVAVMDAYESSACNNTVTFSETLAVRRIVEDLSCKHGGCQGSAAAGRQLLFGGLGKLFMTMWSVAVVMLIGYLGA